MKTFHGIIELPHSIDPRRMALLKERYAEKKKEHLLYCRNQAWMKNGGLIRRNATVICEKMSKTCQMGKHLVNGDLENHVKGPVIPFGTKVEYHPISAKRPVKGPPSW